jgi:basic membrane protein A
LNPAGAADDSMEPIVMTMANLEGDPIGSFPEIREGFQIAVEQINTTFGGIGGRPIDFQVCVHGFDPAAAINCGNEIGQTMPHLNINGIEFFTPALWPTFLGAGIPTIQTVPIFVADFTVEGNGYSLYGGCPVAFPGAATYTVEEMGYKKIAVLYAGTGPGLECFADTEERFWNQLGTEYELDWKGFPDASGDPTDNDANIQAMAEWFEGSPVEDRVVFFGMQASDCNEMLNAISAAGLETAVVSSGSCVDESVLANPAAANSYFEHQSYIAERPDLYDAYSAWELGQREELLDSSPIRTAPISTFLRVGYGAGIAAYQVLSDMITSGQDVDDRAAIISAFAGLENQHVIGQGPTTCTNNTVEYPSVCKKTLTFVKWTGTEWDLGEFDGKIINVGDIQARVANGPYSRSAASAEEVLAEFDANGDGTITIGVAAAGPADDGAYYQAVVDAAVKLSADKGWSSPIIIDEIQPANAADELTNLADQGVDIIIVGASEIAEPLPDLTEEYSDIFWYCNCGAGYATLPGLAQSIDDGAEVGYTTGYAAGLILQENGGTTAAMLGCCDLNFEKEFLLSFTMGIQDVNESFEVSYYPTGDFPYDFNSVPNATEAFNTALGDGVGFVLPYLGGAHEPVVQLANEAGIPVSSAGASDVCARDDLDYAVASRFDGGDYIRAIFPQILNGAVKEGDTKVFKVGVDPEPGGLMCNPTDEQQQAMDDIYANVASGMYAGDFGAIKGQAYGG